MAEVNEGVVDVAVLLLDRRLSRDALFPWNPLSRRSGEGMSALDDDSEDWEGHASEVEGSVAWESIEDCLERGKGPFLLNRNMANC